jgi:hypothetical protein
VSRTAALFAHNAGKLAWHAELLGLARLIDGMAVHNLAASLPPYAPKFTMPFEYAGGASPPMSYRHNRQRVRAAKHAHRLAFTPRGAR